MQVRSFGLQACFISLLAMAGTGVVGCSQLKPPAPDQLNRGLIILLPGVEQTERSMVGMVDGMRDAGCDQAIEVQFWGARPFGTFSNLCSHDLNLKRAAILANRIVDYHRDYPNCPISIAGYSGGGGMALFTAEALPEEVKLERIVLMAAAVSPDYDLKLALARARKGIVNIYSGRDAFMVGWGTKTFGTMDRVWTESAGMLGFRGQDGTLRGDEVTQVPWEKAWCEYGHWGGHGGYQSRAWSKSILSKYLRTQ